MKKTLFPLGKISRTTNRSRVAADPVDYPRPRQQRHDRELGIIVESVMNKKNNMRWRKVVARLFVKMVYEPENEKRNLRFIHKNFILENQGIAYKTFLGYLDEGKDDLSDLLLPVHHVRSIWDCVNYRMAELENRTLQLPADLEERFRIFDGYKTHMQEEHDSDRAKTAQSKLGNKCGRSPSRKRSAKDGGNPAAQPGK